MLMLIVIFLKERFPSSPHTPTGTLLGQVTQRSHFWGNAAQNQWDD